MDRVAAPIMETARDAHVAFGPMVMLLHFASPAHVVEA